MFYCVYQSIISRFLNLSQKKLSHKIKLNLQENLLFLGEGTIAIIVHDVRYLRISGLETTALDNSNNNRVNSTTTSDILPSVLMTLFIQHQCQWWRNVKIQGETHCQGSGLIWARIVTSRFIQRSNLSTFLSLFPAFFSCRCSQNLYGRRTLEKNVVFVSFLNFCNVTKFRSHFTLWAKSHLCLRISDSSKSMISPPGPRLLDKGCGINWIIFTSWLLIGVLRE